MGGSSGSDRDEGLGGVRVDTMVRVSGSGRIGVCKGGIWVEVVRVIETSVVCRDKLC
jgi:hypothetical protein